jgi:hypothetical protein
VTVEVDQGQRDRHPEKPIEKPETVGSDGGDGHDDEMQRLSKGGVAPSSKTEDHATGWGLTSTAEDPGSGIASSPLYKVQPRTREALMEAMSQAASAVSARDAEGFFEHCEYRTPV